MSAAKRTSGPWIAETCTPDGSAWTIRRAHGFAEFKRHNWDKATALEVAALYNQRDALREALELIAAHTSNCIEQCRAENNASLLRVHATVVSVQIMARKALTIVDGAR